MSGSETDRPSDDCVVPVQVPAAEAGKYSIARDPHAEKDIADYVLGQAPDEDVQHVELIKTEYVLGAKYEIWDVTTNKDRWWVITNLTNLYSQKYFPSLDYTLSFHIGLMQRLMSRDRGSNSDESAPFDELARRQEQVGVLLDQAVEPEEYQAVGMQLRELLISLIEAMRRRVELLPEDSAPKASDFVGWSDVFMNRLCPGSTNKELRSYLKGAAKQTWQLVNWLTHSRAANQASSSIAVHGCDTVIGHFIQVLVRDRTDNLESCPRCTSRNVRSHFDINIGDDGDYFSSCGECGWDNYQINE